jgi:ferredoxin-NADP reductase
LTGERTRAEAGDGKLQLRLVRSVLEAENVVSLLLQSTDGADLPPWSPGAHLDLMLPSGAVRQYSLCGEPADRQHYRIAVLRLADGRGGSVEVHDALKVGQIVTVAGPRNAFELQCADRYLFVAGGIGITPILPMVRHVAATALPWQLFYGGRSRASLSFVDEVANFGRANVWLLAEDEVGSINTDAVLASAADGVAVYACGPARMLDALEAKFAGAGRANQLHVERFLARPTLPLPDDGVIRVFLARKGGFVDVPPDRSILNALREAGHDWPSSCEQGICGTCEARVLDGTPDHRDSLLSDSERALGKVMMLCVSRALSPTLTLDV